MAMRVALVSCVKSKRPSAAPARDLYISPLFTALRCYAQSHADRWYILSAKHGLLEPNKVIEPYELTLASMPKAARLAWAERVRNQLLQILPPNAEIILLAGSRYRENLESFLLEHGFSVSAPLRGLSLGRMLHWLNSSSTRSSDDC